MLALVILTLVCVVTYSVEMVFGRAGTILMLPISGYWFPVKASANY